MDLGSILAWAADDHDGRSITTQFIRSHRVVFCSSDISLVDYIQSRWLLSELVVFVPYFLFITFSSLCSYENVEFREEGKTVGGIHPVLVLGRCPPLLRLSAPQLLWCPLLWMPYPGFDSRYRQLGPMEWAISRPICWPYRVGTE